MINYKKQIFADNSAATQADRLDALEQQIKEMQNQTNGNEPDDFVSAIKQVIKECVRDALKENGSASTMTKEEIMKIKDTAERQKAIRANMHLFK